VERAPEEPPPFVVLVQGPPGVGKSTLIRCLVRHCTRQALAHVRGPITVVAGKSRRLTFVECPQARRPRPRRLSLPSGACLQRWRSTPRTPGSPGSPAGPGGGGGRGARAPAAPPRAGAAGWEARGPAKRQGAARGGAAGARAVCLPALALNL